VISMPVVASGRCRIDSSLGWPRRHDHKSFVPTEILGSDDFGTPFLGAFVDEEPVFSTGSVGGVGKFDPAARVAYYLLNRIIFGNCHTVVCMKLRVTLPVRLPLKLHGIFVQINLTPFAEKDGGDEICVKIRYIRSMETHLLLRAIGFLDYRVGHSVTLYDCSTITSE
jgi:hypothetical protein